MAGYLNGELCIRAENECRVYDGGNGGDNAGGEQAVYQLALAFELPRIME